MNTKILLITALVISLAACKNRNSNTSTVETGCDTSLQQKQLTKIECIWVVDGGNNEPIYTIQDDTLYFDHEKARIDERDRHFMDSKLGIIDSLKEYRTGTCIENDASGIIYRLWIGDTASEWISCFSKNQTAQTDQIKLINVLDKYFYYVLNSKGANMKAPDYIETFTSSK